MGTVVGNTSVSSAKIGGGFDDNREHVRCHRCELMQYAADLCRRCKKPLPKPTMCQMVREVPVAARIGSRNLGGGAATSLAELERNAISHALAEADTAIEAAKLLKLGKDILYREVAEIFGQEAFTLRQRMVMAKQEEAKGKPTRQQYLSAGGG